MNITGLRLAYTLITLLLVTFAQSKNIKSAKSTVDSLLNEAKTAQAPMYAPENFKNGQEKFNEAKKLFKKKKKKEKVLEALKSSEMYLIKALEISRSGSAALSEAIQARTAAQKANSQKYSLKFWEEAEEHFTEAFEEYESGDVSEAQKEASKALKLFQEAELKSIKANYLDDTRVLLKKADKIDAEDFAPHTLKTAKDLYQKAEKALSENRYDVKTARDLAVEAEKEAKHAIYLSTEFEKIKDDKNTVENWTLHWENTLQKILDTLGQTASMEAGSEKAQMQIIGEITELKKLIENQKQKLAKRNELISELESKIVSMEHELGRAKSNFESINEKLKKEQEALHNEMLKKQIIAARYSQIEESFNEDEAKVYRAGDKVIIRLTGLTFKRGQNEILPKYFGLLTKLTKAVKIFEGSKVIIEGHTDSQGAAETNLNLSQKRAESVLHYFMANAPDIDHSRLRAVGYGESKPLANNERAEGRAKNRRIDLIIQPNESSAN